MPRLMPRLMPRVIITGTRAPSGLHAARLFHHAGWKVIALESCRVPLSHADRGAYETRTCPCPVRDPKGFRGYLLKTIEQTSARMIFPACEEVFHLSQALEVTGYESLLYAPSRETLLEAHSKAAFPEMLKRAGLEAPVTLRIEPGHNLEQAGARLSTSVLKPEYSRFAVHTILHPEKGDLDRIALLDAPWVCQERLEGLEICVHALVTRGEVMGMSIYAPKYRVGRGAGVYFDPVLSSETERYLSQLVAATGWTGQIGLDVILTPDRGPVAIECNPRATSGLHFFRDAVSFAEAVDGRRQAVVSEAPLMISLAMLGAPLCTSIREFGFRTWLADFTHARDALDLARFSPPTMTMIRSAAGFCASAMLGRRSVLDETTADIAWNGVPHPGTALVEEGRA